MHDSYWVWHCFWLILPASFSFQLANFQAQQISIQKQNLELPAHQLLQKAFQDPHHIGIDGGQLYRVYFGVAGKHWYVFSIGTLFWFPRQPASVSSWQPSRPSRSASRSRTWSSQHTCCSRKPFRTHIGIDGGQLYRVYFGVAGKHWYVFSIGTLFWFPRQPASVSSWQPSRPSRSASRSRTWSSQHTCCSRKPSRTHIGIDGGQLYGVYFGVANKH